ncbi:hypothetical protein ACHWQZ_G008069 [Mnemiopsis leidyi]
MGEKRPVEELSDELTITPLGAGQEVGRSCILLQFKGKRVLLDIGIHPGLSGLEALPFIDVIDTSQIDLLLVSHFHLDHCGALPYLLEKTNFKGRTFMTHATKAIYKWILADYIKVSNITTEDRGVLYTEKDLDNSLDKIETMNFHEEIEVNGIRFWSYNAGHVLGAAMFMIEIAGVKLLYTGDFSRQEDRHLMAAEVPNVKPDILIIESTYGTHIHEKREVREARFTQTVHDTISRGGRCLIPVFALGRAQELMLILDEYWEAHPELHDVPIYYASSLAKKCMAVFQTYVNAMNDKIRRQISVNNPFVFKHISNLKNIDQFQDIGPSVVMASPGMLQSGLSRELFETWCPDHRNSVIIAGYCVEGTLAKMIMSEPEEITSITGQRLPLKCSVTYISFSAHTDYEQTSEFIRLLKPGHIILVHGEHSEMQRLRSALRREYEDKLDVFAPANNEEVIMNFRGEKMAKVVGRLASKKPKAGDVVSGVLVKRGFNYHIVSPEELQHYTDLEQGVVLQKQTLPFTAPFSLLHHCLLQLAGGVEQVEQSGKNCLKVFDSILVVQEKNKVVIQWEGSNMNDMYADAVLTLCLQIEANPQAIKQSSLRSITQGKDKSTFEDRVQKLLVEMFGEESVSYQPKLKYITVTVDNDKAVVNLKSYEVQCQNETLHQMITSAIKRLHIALTPVNVPTIAIT